MDKFQKDQSHDSKSKFKIRIYSQAFVYERRNEPKVEKQMTNFGVEVPVQNWYDEHECEQLAINYNGLYIKEHDVKIAVEELGKAIIKSMRKKGLII